MKNLFILLIATNLLSSVVHSQDKRYGIESAILKSKMVMMGQEAITTQYFINYGKDESAESVMKVQGQEISTFSIVKDGYTYVVNMNTKQGTKLKMTNVMADYKTINFLKITDDVKKTYNIEEKGKEQFLGKECTVYDMSYAIQGQSAKTTVWVWQGISLKAKVSVMGNTIVNEVTEIS
jgi:hypothetical protein